MPWSLRRSLVRCDLPLTDSNRLVYVQNTQRPGVAMETGYVSTCRWFTAEAQGRKVGRERQCSLPRRHRGSKNHKGLRASWWLGVFLALLSRYRKLIRHRLTHTADNVLQPVHRLLQLADPCTET